MNRSFLFIIVLCFLTSSAYAQRTDSLIGHQVNIAKVINTRIAGEPLNYLVNSPFKELGPLPTKDGKRLYFSRQGHPDNTGGTKDEDIWYCEFDEASQSWKEAVNIGPPLNNTGPNFVTGVGSKGDTLLLGNIYSKKGKMSAGVSVCIRIGDEWSFPEPVNIASDYNFAGRASYDLSADRSALIIAQQKIDSHGKLDLYVTFRDSKNKNPYSGTESVNLGPVINSFGNETSPWLSYDNKTLFFCSDGHNGYGKLDIFMSRRLNDSWTSWSKPENLGPGINSPYDDENFNFNPNGRHAYYSRGITETNSDIYAVDMTFMFKNPDFKNPPKKDSVFNKEQPVMIGQTYVVKNAFDDNMASIKSSAMTDLQALLDFLKANKKYNMLIVAHSNIHANREESLTLSNRRAAVVMDYLISNGIDKRRLSYQGMGQDILVNTKDTTLKKDISNLIEFKFVNFR